MKITVDVENEDRVIRRIKQDIRRGTQEGLKDLANVGKETARAKIDSNPRPHIFTGEMIASFEYVDASSGYHLRGKLVNTAEHAGAMENGVSPAEYADGGPPVQALLPWVVAKLQGLNLGNDFDGRSGTVTVEFEDWNGETLKAEIDNGYLTFDTTNQPNREKFYIGQDVVIGDRSNSEHFETSILSQNGDYVEVEMPDGSIQEITIQRSETIFLGIEDWSDRTSDEKLEDIRKYIIQLDGTLDHSDKVDYGNQLSSYFFDSFHDRDDAKRVANAAVKMNSYSGSGLAATTGETNTEYTLKYKSSNSRRTVVHEAFHGYHITKGYSRDAYADWPDDEDQWVYPDFQFDRDGNSLSGLPDMDEHLLKDDDGYIPGGDKKGEMYDLAHGNFDLNYDTSVDESSYFDPNGWDMEVGDVIKINHLGETRELEIENTHSKLRDESKYAIGVSPIGEQNSEELYVDNDGIFTVSDMDLLGVDKSGVDTSLPLSDTEDIDERIIEAANLVWMHKVFRLSKWKKDNGNRPLSELDSLNHFWRTYDIRNPNEVITNLGELYVLNSLDENIIEVYNDYPELVEAFFDKWEPSVTVKDNLEKYGIDY